MTTGMIMQTLILRHQYGISVVETQTFVLAKRPQWQGAGENGCFGRL